MGNDTLGDEGNVSGLICIENSHGAFLNHLVLF